MSDRSVSMASIRGLRAVPLRRRGRDEERILFGRPIAAALGSLA